MYGGKLWGRGHFCPSLCDWAGQASWDRWPSKLWLAGSGVCRCGARRPLLLLLLGGSFPPSHRPSAVCMTDFHQTAGEDWVPLCKTSWREYTFKVSNKGDFCSHLVCLKERGSASQTSFQMETTWYELLISFKKSLSICPHVVHHSLTGCRKSKGAPQVSTLTPENSWRWLDHGKETYWEL